MKQHFEPRLSILELHSPHIVESKLRASNSSLFDELEIFFRSKSPIFRGFQDALKFSFLFGIGLDINMINAYS